MLSLMILPDWSVIRLPTLELSSPDLKVATSINSDLLKTWTSLNLLPIILEALKIFLICSGVALVAISKS